MSTSQPLISPAASSPRWRLQRAIAGDPIDRPVFAVYDWFVKNRPQVDWPSLFALGLGQINHADLVRYRRPHVEIVETTAPVEGGWRRDVRWITDRGELHEWYLGEWRQEYLIKTADDYRIMERAWTDVEVIPSDADFLESEQALGDRGITVGQLDRTPFQKIQIDYAGLARFSVDIADETPQLMSLLELMTGIKLQEFRAIRGSLASQIKLWENLSIQTMGPRLYRRHLVPVYRRIFELLEGTDKKLQVHYDGKLRIIADDVRQLPFDGIDSFTPPPEGDMSAAEARQWWPDKFLWLHPTLAWYSLPPDELARHVREMAQAAGPYRYCLMISEEVPPNWQVTVPLILDSLAQMRRGQP